MGVVRVVVRDCGLERFAKVFAAGNLEGVGVKIQ
jgi:hypothetical protein